MRMLMSKNIVNGNVKNKCDIYGTCGEYIDDGNKNDNDNTQTFGLHFNAPVKTSVNEDILFHGFNGDNTASDVNTVITVLDSAIVHDESAFLNLQRINI